MNEKNKRIRENNIGIGGCLGSRTWLRRARISTKNGLNRCRQILRVPIHSCSCKMDAIGRRNGSRKRLLFSSSSSTNKTSAKGKQFEQLARLNAMVEQAWQAKQTNSADTELRRISPGFLHESVWDTWLWGEDPLEEAPVSTTLNRMQLLGLLIARYAVWCWLMNSHV